MGIHADKSGRFALFWAFFGVLGILLIGSFITPMQIVLDDVFRNIDDNATNNGNTLSCSNVNAPNYIKATCFTLGGFIVMFILYILYYWVSGMIEGAKKRTPVLSQRYNQFQIGSEG